jgi:hypothetical protein
MFESTRPGADREASVDPMLEAISKIETRADFVRWVDTLRSSIDVEENGFDRNPALVEFMSEISRWSNSEYQGSCMHLSLSENSDPKSWQLVAHVLYATYPSED